MTLLSRFHALQQYLDQQVIGQTALTQRLLVALLCRGHVLVEGAPGLAKTRAISALSDALDGSFQRIQFTPDLLPADLTGSDVYRHETGAFEFVQGPLFHSLILADEINRAPAKVQSALLEAMAEGQISVGQHSYALPQPFLVMATQNPLEQVGTYRLPEAQLDRFLLHVLVDYPSLEAERQILRLVRGEWSGEQARPPRALLGAEIIAAGQETLRLYMDEAVESYLLRIVAETRQPRDAQLAQWIAVGASPRASLALERSARAQAWLDGRDYVSPSDVQHVAPDVLRHRLVLDYAADADGMQASDVVRRLLECVAVG